LQRKSRRVIPKTIRRQTGNESGNAEESTIKGDNVVKINQWSNTKENMMRQKKQILAGLFIVLLLCAGRLLAADDAARLISDDFMYSTPLATEDSLIDFAGDKNKGIVDLSFATHPKLNRGSNDYKIELDASTAVKFMVDIENLNPQTPYSLPVFYFKSGDGWYSVRGNPVPLSRANICRYEF
ncbi:MAG: hypothetical protein PHQ75_13510, partial [Thermoguttaceae bacterium]|nr:hypothetical protein [Thermoguttaceae bacterium]